MSDLKEKDLIQFWKDANSYQSIDPTCFNIQEFKDNWLRDKIGHEALELANGLNKETEEALTIPVVSGSFYNHKPTGIKGTLLKKYKPTGKPETIMIDTLDNDVYFAPAHEFEQVNYR